MTVNTRWQACGIHLLISGIIFIGIALLILFIWYPGYFAHFGGYKGLGMIAAIDLVLGPLLTLLVYNTAKKHLKWDLTAIGLAQFSALAFGLWSIHQGKPIAQVLSHQGVFIITYNHIKTYNLNLDDIKKVDSKTPALIYLDLPDTLDLANQAAYYTEMLESKPFATRTDLYRAYTPDLPPLLADFIKSKQITPACAKLSLLSSQTDQEVCFNINTAQITVYKQ